MAASAAKERIAPPKKKRRKPAAKRPARKAAGGKRKQQGKAMANPKGRPVRPVLDVDAEWIQERLKQQHKTQRELAAAWGGASAAAVTRVLRNNRRLSLDEFVTLCDFLRVAPGDLLPRLGYQLGFDDRRITIEGAVNEQAQVTHVTPEAGRRLSLPAHVQSANSKALVIRAKAGYMQAWAGAVVLYDETPRGSVHAYDRLAVVEVVGEVVPVLGVLRRGSKAKSMVLRKFALGEESEVSEVIAAHPVRQIVME